MHCRAPFGKSSLLFLVFATSTTAFAGELFIDPMFEVQVQEGIVFGTGSTGNPASGEISLALDLFTPVGAEFAKPGILLLYGGGFETRYLEQLKPLAEELASRGWVAATGDYRIVSDDPTFEPGPWGPQSEPLARAGNAAFNDAAKGLAWLNENAAQLGIDPDRIVIGGASSGAVISLIEGYRNNSASAIVSLCGGMYGFESLIDAGDPPVVLAHGTADDTVPYAMAEAVVARAETVGVPNALLTFEGGGHCEFAFDPLARLQTLNFANEFLYDRLELATIPEPSTLALGIASVLALLTAGRRRW